MTTNSYKPAPRSRRRRFKWLVGLALLPIFAILALPWILNSAPGRFWLIGQGNKALAPGGFRVSRMDFSWFAPTRITDLTLIDPRRGPVMNASRATWDRNLRQILFDRPNLGTLRLEGASLDTQRAEDGSIDLYETLKPILGRDPKTALKIKIIDGRLKIQGAGLPKPVVADHMDLDFQLNPHPLPLHAKLSLANREPGAASSLTLEGRIDQWAAKEGREGDLGVSVTGKAWPIDLALKAVSGTLKGTLDGYVNVKRVGGHWTSDGDATLGRVDVSAQSFAGDHFLMDSLIGKWDVATSGGNLTIRRLDFEAAVAAIKPWFRSASESLNGSCSVRGSVRPAIDGHDLAARLDLNGLSRTDGDDPGETLRLAVNAHLPVKRDQIEMSELSLKSRFVSVQGSGKLVEPNGSRQADFKGTVSPQWDAINSWLGSHIEPGATVKGKAQDFRIAARLGPDWRKSLEGSAGVAITSADLYGMILGPTALTLRARQGRFLIDPIDTSLNGGRLHLEPELKLAEKFGETSAILVHEGTSLQNAEINDTVSRRVLAFVAPVFDNATRVNGRISAEIDEAVFPIGGEGTKGLKVEGDVMFQDVQFLPGPLFNELLAVAGRNDRPLLTLNEPVALTIADRRVYQSGLKVPIGKIGEIDIEGWIDFDQNMNLVTSVPILPNVLAERPILGGLAGDARIKIPIRGTLKAPEIDKQAFDLGMKDLGKTMLDRTVGPGLSDLIQSMAERAKANPPAPRLTPAERRERRVEKKRERQDKRGMAP